MMAANKQGQSLGEYVLFAGVAVTFCLLALQPVRETFLSASNAAAGRLNVNAALGLNKINSVNANDNNLEQVQVALMQDTTLPETVKKIATNPPPSLVQLQTALEAGNYAEVAGGFGELGEATYQLSLALEALVKNNELTDSTTSDLLALAREGKILANRQYVGASELLFKTNWSNELNGYIENDLAISLSVKDRANQIGEEIGGGSYTSGGDTFNGDNLPPGEVAKYWIAETEKQAQQFASVFQQVQANPPAGLSSSDWQTVQTLATAIKGNWSVLTYENAKTTDTSSQTMEQCATGCGS